MKNTKQLFICFIGIVLIASILRAPITSVSPLLTNIVNTINISPVTAGLLVSLPLLIFATLSVFIFSFTKKTLVGNKLNSIYNIDNSWYINTLSY